MEGSKLILLALSSNLLPSLILQPHTAHSAAAAMYKTCNDQWDEESDDEKNSLYSSFWSDGEAGDKEEEEEEVEIMRGVDCRPVCDPEGSPAGSLKEEHPELKRHCGSDGGTQEGEEDDGKSPSSSCGSPPVSPVTSGYGTYRADEQEVAENRDARSTIGFNRCSREDLSEFRDDEEDSPSLKSFIELQEERTPGPDEPAAGASGGGAAPTVATRCESHCTPKEVSELHMDLPTGTGGPSEVRQRHTDVDNMLLLHEERLKDGLDESQGGDEQLFPSDDPDQSSSYKDVRYKDCRWDFCSRANDRMSVEAWRRDAASCLEERIAELDLSPSDQESEAESEDVTDESSSSPTSEADGFTLSAFQSYINGMAQTQSNRDGRPKPKSFIRPVSLQPTIKKTDPVAKYFQYKQMWEMFQLSGEKDRKALRWEIKPRPRRVYVPNTYVIPTEKKRSELRWVIRNDLANGLLPQKF
ncbi:uncharacterized protein si:dkey-23f9.4 isoform X2 [Cyprinodon tularosa]|uniref:uncharacterized protein si:dkey-23f9.4 isoform X2 n=1 Tax=Cyprinodon tularosa TaxID=77115 RepID=UPI0018E217C9|nr:uncharacterized protein si:dkey-23f9.4 isoform X2 [Cyprinodon tularosa]